MKTHDHEIGDFGCRAVILKHFCSTASFWKLKTFITPLTIKTSFSRGVGYAVRRHFLRWGCVRAKTHFALRV